MFFGVRQQQIILNLNLILRYNLDTVIIDQVCFYHAEGAATDRVLFSITCFLQCTKLKKSASTMKVDKVECVSYKKVSPGLRKTKFQCSYVYDHDVHMFTSRSKNSFTIITVDHELELEWKIEFSRVKNSPSIVWERLVLQKSDSNIFGHFVIGTTSGGCEKGSFHSDSLPLEKELYGVFCENSRQNFLITIYVYREDSAVSSAIEDYNKFLKNQKTCDVTFVVGNEEITAHKQIMSARSEVFAKMLSSRMVEKKTGRVEITDVEPNIFKMFLSFIYSLELESDKTDDLLKLIVVADKYSVKSLVHGCEYNLSKNLNDENAVDILLVADMVKANFLKKDCILYIIKNKTEIGATEAYKEMVRSRSDLLSEIFLHENLKFQIQNE